MAVRSDSVWVLHDWIVVREQSLATGRNAAARRWGEIKREALAAAADG